MKVITFATSDQGWFQALRTSCRRNRLQLEVLGWGEPWEGFLHKPRAVLRHLQTTAPDELVLVVDAFDVLILCGEQEFLRRYADLRQTCLGTIVVGRENIDGPWWMSMYLRLAFPSSLSTSTLNAGVLFGPAADLVRLYGALLRDGDGDDDQKRLNHTAGRLWHILVVDERGDLIHTATAGRPPNLQTIARRPPCLVHAPAGGNLDELCQLLHLPPGRPRDPLSQWLILQSHVRNHSGPTMALVFTIVGAILCVVLVFHRTIV